jgi:hypothetical protein
MSTATATATATYADTDMDRDADTDTDTDTDTLPAMAGAERCWLGVRRLRTWRPAPTRRFA